MIDSRALSRDGALSENDPNSFSNPDEIRPVSMHINWKVDFDAKKVTGSVRYKLVRSTGTFASTVVFDIQELDIKTVRSVDGNCELKYSLGPVIETFGNALAINLPKSDFTETEILIEYETTSKSTALQWLSKEQTAGKEHPYLFSKCSAIQARSLIPCQDTPSVKVPYTAEITAPADLTVLMGAVRRDESDEGQVSNTGSWRRSQFVQKIPIPSYLIAIVVGRLESKRIGPRTCVWAEKSVLDAAAYEFEDTDKMLVAEENLLGEYVWGVYDLLVLPPSFPSGGMENPCLTFVTPTLLAGDKSLANVIAHEIAHSWTGNLVTNKTFEHFWLNEGLTMYVERRVLGILYGEPFRQFLAIGGLKELKSTIREMGSDNQLTALVPNLAGINPMNSLTLIPYEKGFLFLYYLEQVVGGAPVFEGFLKSYIWENAYKSVETSVFREMFIQYFEKTGKAAQIQAIDWDSWLYSPGLPAFEPKYDHTLADVSTQLKTRWTNWDESVEPCPFKASDLDAFTLRSNQLWEFLAQLSEEGGALAVKKIEALDRIYKLSEVQNSEIKFLWMKICIKSEYLPIVPKALEFITEQGRMKFIGPIYKALYAWEAVRERAIETFQRNRPNMMPNSARTISKYLQLDKITL